MADEALAALKTKAARSKKKVEGEEEGGVKDVKVVEVLVEVVPKEDLMVEETAVGEEAGVEVAREGEAMVKETAVGEEAGVEVAREEEAMVTETVLEEDVAVVDLEEDAVVVVGEDVAVVVMNLVLVKVAVGVESHCVSTWTTFARSWSALRRRVCPRQRPSVLPARNG